MEGTIRALVAFSDESDHSAPAGKRSRAKPTLEVVAYADELDEGWQSFFDQKSDVVHRGV